MIGECHPTQRWVERATQVGEEWIPSLQSYTSCLGPQHHEVNRLASRPRDALEILGIHCSLNPNFQLQCHIVIKQLSIPPSPSLTEEERSATAIQIQRCHRPSQASSLSPCCLWTSEIPHRGKSAELRFSGT